MLIGILEELEYWKISVTPCPFSLRGLSISSAAIPRAPFGRALQKKWLTDINI